MAPDLIAELIDAAEHKQKAIVIAGAERMRSMIREKDDQLAENKMQIERQRVELDRRAAALVECQVALAADCFPMRTRLQLHHLA